LNIQKLRAAKHEDEDDDAFTVITLPRSQQQSCIEPKSLAMCQNLLQRAEIFGYVRAGIFCSEPKSLAMCQNLLQ
jgi:hypothetical protein